MVLCVGLRVLLLLWGGGGAGLVRCLRLGGWLRKVLRVRGFVAAALAAVLFGVLFGVLAPGSVGAQTSSVVSSTGDSAVEVGEGSVAVVGFSVSPPVDSEVWLRFCFESSLADSNFSNLQTQIGNMNVSLDNNGCFDGQTVTVTVAGATTQSATIRFQPLTNTVDDLDEVVTVTVSEDPDNPLPDGVSIDAEADSVSRKIVDEDPTVVSLARSGSGAITEGGSAELTVSLGRELVAGEMVGVPLAISGTNVTTADYDLVLKEGQGLNTGVELSGVSTTEPHLSFSGAGAQTATLLLTALLNNDTGAETVTVALGPDDATANGFDRPALETNVSGGVNRSSTQNSVNVTVNDPAAPAAPRLSLAQAGDGQVYLSWANPVNSLITGYEFQRRPSGGEWGSAKGIVGSNANTITYVVTGLTNDTAYTFRVRAVSGNTDGAWSDASAAVTPTSASTARPAVPTNLAAVAGDSQVVLTWDNPGNTAITSYEVRQRTGSADWGTWAAIASSSATTVTHTVTGLTNGVTYQFQVRAATGNQDALKSLTPTDFFAEATPRPAPPTLLVSSRSALRVPEGTTTLGYNIVLSRALTADDPAVLEFEIAVSGTATRGTDYSFSSDSNLSGTGVSVVNTAGKGNPVIRIDRAAFGLTRRGSTAGLIINVNPDSDTESTDETIVLTTPGTTLTHMIYDAPASVEAKFALASSTYAEGFGPLTVVVQLSALTGRDLVFPILYPSATTTAVANVDYTPVNSFTVKANGQLTHSLVIPYVDNDVDEPNKTLSVMLGAAPSGATKATTDTMTVTIADNDATTVALAVADTTLREDTDTRLTVTLSRDLVAGEIVRVPLTVSGTGVTADDYTLELASDAGLNTGVRLNIASPFSAASPQVVFTGSSGTEQVATLVLSASYDATSEGAETLQVGFGAVTSNLAHPDRSTFTAAGTTAGAPVDVTVNNLDAPAAPTGLAATAGDTQVSLVWDDPGNNLITGYQFRRGSGDPFSWGTHKGVANSDASTTSYVVTSLTNSTEYSFQVRALINSVEGAWSSTVKATPTSSSTAPPAAPSNVTATAGDTQVVLTWANPGNAAITGYEVRQRAGSSGSWGSWAAIASSSATTVTHTATGLTNGIEYSFEVRAVAGTTQGAASVTVTATPMIEPPILNLFRRPPARLPEGTITDTNFDFRLSRALTSDDPALVDLEVAVSGTATRNVDYQFFSSGTVAGVSVLNTAGTGNLVLRINRATFGTTSQAVSVKLGIRVLPDNTVESSDETIILTPAGGSARTFSVYDAPASVEVNVEQSRLRASTLENRSLHLTLVLDAATGKDLVFPVSYSGTATSGSDYTPVDSFTVKANGRLTHSLVIPYVDDDVDETNETVTVMLGDAPSGATKGSTDTATFTIVDNDATTVTMKLAGRAGIEENTSTQLTVSLSRDLVTGEEVWVPLTVSGTGVTADDYTFSLASGTGLNTGVTLNTTAPYSAALPQVLITGGSAVERFATLTLSAADDSTAENTETLSIGYGSVESNLDRLDASIFSTGGTTTAGAPVTVQISDEATGPTLLFTRTGTGTRLPEGTTLVEHNFVLSRRLNGTDPQVLEYEIGLGGTATRGADYTLRFVSQARHSDGVTVINTAGSSNPVLRINRTVFGSRLTRGTVGLVLSVTADNTVESAAETITLTTSGGSLAYTIYDAPASVEAKFTRAAYGYQEGNRVFTVVIQLNEPTGKDLVFPLSYPQPTTAVSGVDYTPVDSYTVKANGELNHAISFLYNDNNLDELTKTLTVMLGAAPDGVTKGTPDTATVTIYDNTPTAVTLAVNGSSSIEEDTSTQLTVTLGRDLVAGEIVRVPLTVSGTGVTADDYTLELASDAGVNTGVTLNTANPYSAAEPQIVFTGGSSVERVATLVLKAVADNDDTETSETMTISFGSVTSNLDQINPSVFDGSGTAAGEPVEILLGAAVLTLSVDSGTANPTEVVEGELLMITVTRSQANRTGADINVPFRLLIDDVGLVGLADFTIHNGDTTSSASLKAPNDRYDEPTKQAWTAELNTALLPENHVADTSRVAFTVTDNDPTTVTLNGLAGDIAEDTVKRFTITLNRGLVAGETLPVPLVFGGTATRNADYTTACPDPLPVGIQCNNLDTAETPTVTFTGPQQGVTARSVTLTVTAQADLYTENDETLRIALAPLNADSGDGLGGGAVAVNDFDAFNITDTTDPATAIQPPPEDPEEPVDPEPETVPTTPIYQVPTSLIADVRGYAAETHNGAAHVRRWQQVLLAFGDTVNGFTGAPITLTEARTYAQQFWSVRWDPVVEALQQLANNPQPQPTATPQPTPTSTPTPSVYTVPASLIADVRGYAAETHNGAAHVRRWQRVLLAFGEDVPGFTGTPITLTQARTYAQQFWGSRWDPVVEALQQLANNPPPQPNDPSPNNPPPNNPSVDPQPKPVLPRIGVTAPTDITEGQTADFTFTAVSAPATPLTVTVNIITTGDYGITAGSRTVTIDTNGTATLSLATIGDSVDEPNGTITVTLTTSNTYNVDSAAATATVTIADDDAPVQTTSTPIISIADQTITEGTSCRTPAPWSCLNLYPVTVTLNQPHHQSVWVSFTITQLGQGTGYATANQDFAARDRRSFIIAAGQTTKNIYVNIKDDNTKEPDETFQITLHNPLRGQIGDGQATITIKDND